MPMNVQSIPTLSDRVNQIRLLTAEIVNKRDPPQREQALGGRAAMARSLESDREAETKLAICATRSKHKVKQAGCGRRTFPRSTVAAGSAFSNTRT